MCTSIMKNIQAFSGFTPATFQFFKDIEANNYKDWFEANKAIYEKEVLTPLKELATALSPMMYNIDSRIDLRLARVVSRIYRDTRFSKNKDPYKNKMWIYFEQPTDDCASCPGFYIEFSADGYLVDMGMYKPKKKEMDNLRDKIVYDAQVFERESKKILERGFIICGDEYKRPLKNELPQYFQQWIQRKSIYVNKSRPIGEELFSADLIAIIRKDIEALVWLYNFMKDE